MPESETTESVSVAGFELPESGEFVLVATRYFGYFGNSRGAFSLDLRESSEETLHGLPNRVITYGETVRTQIDDEQPDQFFSFRGVAGDTVSIQAISEDFAVDTTLFLMDNTGTSLIYNDDDYAAGNTNAHISGYVLPYDGFYTVWLSRYGDGEGAIDLTMTLDDTAERDDQITRFAALNNENSRTYRSDGVFFANFAAGDTIDDAKNELTLQALLTFYLPPSGGEIVQATLLLEPCYQFGLGFEELGELTLYEDNFGLLTVPRSYARPFSGARILATTESCSPIDLTEVIEDMYAANETQLQLRLTFRNAPTNGNNDEVDFTPRLVIKFQVPAADS
jgi:hypothetical protein